MKRIFYLSILFFGLGFVQSADAQINVNVNIGSQPLWGPVGYDYVRFYYMPEIDVYYDVAHRRYTYYQGNRWVTKSKLPGRYKNFDIYRTYKVVLNDSNPWRYHRRHRDHYSRYAHNHSQVIIRDGGRSRYDKHNHRGHGHYDKKSHKKYEKHSKKHDRRDWDD